MFPLVCAAQNYDWGRRGDSAVSAPHPTVLTNADPRPRRTVRARDILAFVAMWRAWQLPTAASRPTPPSPTQSCGWVSSFRLGAPLSIANSGANQSCGAPVSHTSERAVGAEKGVPGGEAAEGVLAGAS
eukprot:scaffold2527_cov337-Prasinococcus_capsulatus_cf.AAC.5